MGETDVLGVEPLRVVVQLAALPALPPVVVRRAVVLPAALLVSAPDLPFATLAV